VAKGKDGRMTIYTTPLPSMNEELESVLAAGY
jgi:hypothetical protein